MSAAGRWGAVGLVACFVVAGLREIGEPARKARITELVPAGSESRAIGLYWAARSVAVCLAPLLGAAVWVAAGPRAMLVLSGAVGLAGASLYWLWERNAGTG